MARSVSASTLERESSRIRIAGHRPRQGRALALAAGQGEPALAHDGLDTFRERFQIAGQARDIDGTLDLVVGGVGLPEQDVLLHAPREQERFLGDVPQALAQTRHGNVVDVDAIIRPEETRARLIEALEMMRTKNETLPPKKHGNIPL